VGAWRHWFYAIAIAAVATSAAAADLPISPDFRQPVFVRTTYPQWEIDVGARYFFSSGRNQTDLFGRIGGPPIFVSRLTWTGLQAQSGELFGRVEHQSGFFIKGFAGGGGITGGNLQDEDFPPVAPGGYSSTNSAQRSGRLAYATVDLGWTWRSGGPRFEGSKLGFFMGYSYNRERLNAFGCTQTTGNPFICVPPIPSSVLGITEEFNWNAIRLGFNGEWRFGGGWILSADLAWVPWAWLNATDIHWLRPFTAPETGGSFNNVQIEALLRYQFVNGLSVGVGGRYWRMDTSGADVNIEGSQQAIALSSQRWGVFLQGSYKFFVLAN
jgi:omptin family protein